MTSRRSILVGLLVASAALFVIGSVIEKSQPTEHHTETTGETSGETHSESGEETHPTTEEPTSESSSQERVLGINIESTPMIVLAVAITLVLAVAAWFSGASILLWMIVAFGIGFAMFDLLEAVHQNKESRSGLVVLAVALAMVHLTIAFVSGTLARRSATASA
jgi:Flp pilus assembly protein TadB